MSTVVRASKYIHWIWRKEARIKCNIEKTCFQTNINLSKTHRYSVCYATFKRQGFTL